MSDPLRPDASRNLLEDREWFHRSAGWIVRGAFVLGLLRASGSLLAVLGLQKPDGLALLAAMLHSASEIVLFGLAGVAGAVLVRAIGAWASTSRDVERSRPADPELVVRALERFTRSSEVHASTEPEPQGRSAAAAELAEVRRLIREHEWDAAEDAVRTFRSDRPDDARGAEIADELVRSRQAALEHLEARLQAAREVNDPDQVLEVHGRIQPLVDLEKRKNLDGELARWFLIIVHRRLRGGRIQPDVVALADRIAESFGHTTEGASLRAALPTLRRSAGLCPRCAQPFTGAGDACPACLAAPAPNGPPTEAEPEEIDMLATRSGEADWFVDPSEESAA